MVFVFHSNFKLIEDYFLLPSLYSYGDIEDFDNFDAGMGFKAISDCSILMDLSQLSFFPTWEVLSNYLHMF